MPARSQLLRTTPPRALQTAKSLKTVARNHATLATLPLSGPPARFLSLLPAPLDTLANQNHALSGCLGKNRTFSPEHVDSASTLAVRDTCPLIHSGHEVPTLTAH